MKIGIYVSNFNEAYYNSIEELINKLSNFKYKIAINKTTDFVSVPIPESINSELILVSNNIDDFNRHFSDVDLLHVFFDGFTSLKICSNAYKSNIPYVISFGEGYDINLSIFPSWMINLTVLISNRATCITVVSEHGKEKLLERGVVNDIKVISIKNDNHRILNKDLYKIFIKSLNKKETNLFFDKREFNNNMLKCGHPESLKALDNALENYGEKNDSLELMDFGGQGLIYNMFSRKIQKNIIIKVPNFARQEERKYEVIRRNIKKEGELLYKFNLYKCNYIPEIYSYDKENGEYIIREFVDGKSLFDLIDNSLESDIDNNLKIFFKMTISLFTIAHKYIKYCIRDFKSKNIIVSKQNNYWKLIDLGGCRPECNMYSKRHDKNKMISKIGSGKYLHWSPEQLLETPNSCDRRVDYFSFGVICFHIINKKLPYTNKEKNIEKVLHKYRQEYNEAIKLVNNYKRKSQLKPEILDFIIKCLNPDVHCRPDRFPNSIKNYFINDNN